MDLTELGVEVVQKLISSIPEIIITVSIIVYNLLIIKKQVKLFPDAVTGLSQAFDKTKSDLNGEFSFAKEEVKKGVECIREEVKEVLNKAVTDLSDMVAEPLSLMKEELAGFKNELQQAHSIIKTLTVENRAFLDIITSVTATDPDKIQSGVATIISKRVGSIDEETKKLQAKK